MTCACGTFDLDTEVQEWLFARAAHATLGVVMERP